LPRHYAAAFDAATFRCDFDAASHFADAMMPPLSPRRYYATPTPLLFSPLRHAAIACFRHAATLSFFAIRRAAAIADMLPCLMLMALPLAPPRFFFSPRHFAADATFRHAAHARFFALSPRRFFFFSFFHAAYFSCR
jgi:hypothetical protein